MCRNHAHHHTDHTPVYHTTDFEGHPSSAFYHQLLARFLELTVSLLRSQGSSTALYCDHYAALARHFRKPHVSDEMISIMRSGGGGGAASSVSSISGSSGGGSISAAGGVAGPSSAKKGGAVGGGALNGAKMEGSRAGILRDMVTLKYGANHPLTTSCIIEVSHLCAAGNISS